MNSLCRGRKLLYRHIASVVLSVFLVSSCFATRYVIVVTPKGIVLGVDSEVTHQEFKNGEQVQNAILTRTKVAIIKRHIVVGIVGLTRLRDPKGTVLFDFSDWIGRIQREVPGDISVESFAAIIEGKSRRIRDLLNNIPPAGRQGIRFRVPLQFVIFGYDHFVASGYTVFLKFDGNQLSGPFKLQVHPNKGISVDNVLTLIDSKVLAFQVACAIHQIKDPTSPAHAQAVAKFPAEVPALIAGKDIGLRRTADVVAFLLSLESRCDPQGVGPPYIITTIKKYGPISTDYYDANATRLVATKDALRSKP